MKAHAKTELHSLLSPIGKKGRDMSKCPRSDSKKLLRSKIKPVRVKTVNFANIYEAFYVSL
jgi:hypothetical protein